MDGGNEQSCHKILFQSQSICNRNSRIGAKDLWEWGSELIKLFRWYSWFWDGRELADDERGGCPKLNWTEVNIAAVADLVKNDSWITSRMIAESLNIPKSVVPRILKEDLGKSCVHVLFHIPWHLSKGEIEPHIGKILSRWPMQTKFFCNKIITGAETWCFFLWPRNKATEFWMAWWDIPSAEETEIPKAPHQGQVGNFFYSQDVMHKEFLPEGNRVNA